MTNKLEKYLKEKRGELDVEQPDDQAIWEGIRQGLEQDDGTSGRKKIWLQIRNIAAVAILFLAMGYFLNEMLGGKKDQQQISLSAIDKKLGEREQEYRTKVKYIQKEIADYTFTENEVINEILQEIKQVDTIYNQCLKDLRELGYDERVINTIFDTYEQKIFLLELIILEYNKTQYHENDESLTL